MIGKTLSHYKVLEKIGQGGMGEVYRAEDTNLSREVAIKVLPEQFTKDPQRLARFEREAKLLASLNHPNIAAIYGLEEADGVRFLALELVPGKTLAERVARGPVPVEEALEVCRQIAEGVEAAHEKGVIHRDLKPSNVKVTPEGKVKILDFGLAKAFEEETPVTDISQSPTLTEEMTRAGVILGTAAYMSPEQAKGKPVDKRADIFAFGSVLYELLTARRAFGGETITETIAAVLKSEPEWARLPENTPWGIRTLLRRCLQKETNRRLQHIGDVRIEIEEALTEPDSTETVEVRRPVHLFRLLLLALFVSIGIALWGWLQRPPPTSLQVTRSAIILEHPLALSTGRAVVALSPDGTRLVAVVDTGATTQLYLREMVQSNGHLIPGTEGAISPFFSPDGQSVGFVADPALKTVILFGGAPVSWGYVPPVTQGATWVGEDNIILSSSLNAGLSSISRSGSTTLTLPDPEEGEGSHRWPQVVPDGRFVLFTAESGGGFDEAKVGALSLDSGETRVLIEGGTNAQLTASGHLVFGRRGALLAVPFDVSRLEVKGSPVTVLEGVSSDAQTGAVHYAVSDVGSIVYVEGEVWVPENKVVWVDPMGETETVLTERRLVWNAAVSPGGSRIAMTVTEGSNSEIWMYDVERGTLTRLTFDPGEDFNPVWSPDGEWIAFTSEMNGGPPQLHRMPADGSRAPEQLSSISPTPDAADVPTSWSPDGSFLAYRHGGDIWLLPLEDGSQPAPFVETEFREHGASFSPVGGWIAYHSDESGRPEVYMQPFPGPGAKQQVSSDGGAWPLWSADGTKLFYRNGNEMMEVTVAIEPRLRLSKPRLVFTGKYSNGIGHSNYSVSANGKGFLMVGVEEPEPQTRLRLVLNWFEELKRLVPTN